MTTLCPFCNPEPNRVFHQGRLVLALWDTFPVTEGHALIVTKRHVATWFAATAEEQAEITAAVEIVRAAIEARSPADGYNVGINIGEAAGQTVPHLHVHVIPRRLGDVADPRGGVRHVIPALANYLAPATEPRVELLSTGPENPLLPLLERDLATATQIDIAVAFALPSGVERLYPHLEELLARGGSLRLLTGDYLDVTDPEALQRLLDLQTLNPTRRVLIRIYECKGLSFHPKTYIVSQDGDFGVAYVGSSNLSDSALREGVEWNYRVIHSRDQDGFLRVRAAFDVLFAHPNTCDVTTGWIDRYRDRRSPPQRIALGIAEAAPEIAQPVAPNAIQQIALEKLEGTRAAGFRAGLVVMATGLGKTWLAAFDARPFKKILFVAHREEILGQALNTFRRIRPKDSMGLYSGTDKLPEANILFASVQTLSRRSHLDRFNPKAFDYIVIDEFHHASAQTYRRLIDHFEPMFLLGLTATPERTDGGDLLALCQENLVYRCDVAEGIKHELLCPFSYYGVPDHVDYANIPWRSRHFEEAALTAAVATQERAANIFEQWRARGGRKTLAFCVSQRHADFMREFFKERGIEVAAVHSGASSDPRALSLERLENGDLKILFAVDIFNEGVDVPSIDTVMMLRPTESRIVWLQQFGRGLRRCGDKRLTVIDYIGNHRSFLLKAQTLLQLRAGDDRELSLALEKVQAGEWELPPGCNVTYELEAINILRSLLRPAKQDDALADYYREFRERRGSRPTALEAFHDGYLPRAVRKEYGSWLGFVKAMGDFNDTEQRAFAESAPLLEALDVTKMTRSFKMLVLLAALNADKLPGPGIPIHELATEFRRLAQRSGKLREDVGPPLLNDGDLRRLIVTNPVAAWIGGKATDDIDVFEYRDEVFRYTPKVTPECRTVFQSMVRELADWRLAEYVSRTSTQGNEAGFTMKVSHTNGRPILFLPDREQVASIPDGWQTVLIDGEPYQANFVKVAVNVIRRQDSEDNELPQILRGWFGPDAGKPGTNHAVLCEPADVGFRLSPATRNTDETAELWRKYSREQIPRLFGEQFNKATWNAGFVKVPSDNPMHVCLLVTLSKKGMSQQFQYVDKPLSDDVFQWHAQNRTTRTNKDGQLLQNHVARGVLIHLFVRARKRHGGSSAPFVYCGPVNFESWQDGKPSIVRWKLSSALPPHLLKEFNEAAG